MQTGLVDTFRRPVRNGGASAAAISAALTTFYLLLYLPGSAFTPGFPDVLSPVASALHLPSKWFLYGALYTVLMIGGAVAMLRRHGNSRYHRARTASLLVVQVTLAFALPLALSIAGKPELYLSYVWPLSYDKLFPGTLAKLPAAAAIWFVFASLVGFPWLAWRYGKRSYCSWICGCGGLAETFGDPWRHLSDKSPKAWRIERISIYTVLAAVITMTLLVFGEAVFPGTVLGSAAGWAKAIYSFFVGAIFSGVIGVGLYPLMGSRVWCRFGCPMAAILGIAQLFGRFRVAVQPNQCISCGNCSTYCEMGIDVRAYAMANLDVRRASCVGCGMCAHVCPRGVLRLTHGPGGPLAPVQGQWVLEL